jgi:hypothetical protein
VLASVTAAAQDCAMDLGMYSPPRATTRSEGNRSGVHPVADRVAKRLGVVVR